MKIEIGLIFTGIWFKGRIEVLKVDEQKNELKVKLNSEKLPKSGDYHWFETWDLKVVKIGFKNGDYLLYNHNLGKSICNLANECGFRGIHHKCNNDKFCNFQSLSGKDQNNE